MGKYRINFLGNLVIGMLIFAKWFFITMAFFMAFGLLAAFIYILGGNGEQ